MSILFTGSHIFFIIFENIEKIFFVLDLLTTVKSIGNLVWSWLQVCSWLFKIEEKGWISNWVWSLLSVHSLWVDYSNCQLATTNWQPGHQHFAVLMILICLLLICIHMFIYPLLCQVLTKCRQWCSQSAYTSYIIHIFNLW